MLYRAVVRPLAFCLDPEYAHDLALAALSRLRLPAPPPPDGRLAVEAMGIRFANPVGLAAGMDKDGRALAAWAAMGFGCVEVGTVTPRPQPGNPRPRLFRRPADLALVNRMGFNSAGAEAVARNLARRPRGLVVGVSLGKNRDTPPERAAEDYAAALGPLHAHADYVVVNVSSPNTPGLTALQAASHLERIVSRVQEANRRPLLVKVSPDLAPEELDAAVRVAAATGCAGVVATNTMATPDGGLSGAPLRALATEVVRRAYLAARGTPLVIVGVGGIASAEDAYEKIRAGSSLVQILTGLVYEGPGLVQRIGRELVNLMERDGLDSLNAAVGSGARP